MISTHIMLANQGHPYIHSTTVLCDMYSTDQIQGIIISRFESTYIQSGACTCLGLVWNTFTARLNVFEAGFESVRGFSPNLRSCQHGFDYAFAFSRNARI